MREEVPNCAVFCLSRLTYLPPRAVEVILRNHHRGMLRVAADAAIRDVRVPDILYDLLPPLGFDVAEYHGEGPADVRGWARLSASRFLGDRLLVTAESRHGLGDPRGRRPAHSLLVEAGWIFDNMNPRGLRGGDHPYRDARVLAVHRVRSE
jgi:hypothetical protein